MIPFRQTEQCVHSKGLISCCYGFPPTLQEFVQDQLISAVEDLSKEKAIEVLTLVLDASTRERATILLYAKEHEIGENIRSTFHDINQWKGTRQYE